ncbi:CMAH hydroxylase, partial [Amia calva]|nr:CMAH hydroxylase [Amia calva]
MAQEAKVIFTLTFKEASELKDGINLKRNKEDGKCYIIYKDKEMLRACKNQCKHQGGLFIKDIEDINRRDSRSTSMQRLSYVLLMSCSSCTVVEMDESGGIQLIELSPPDPWLSDPRTPEELQFGDINYLTHACTELKLGSKRMLFDPWLTGPAFSRGWWLLHEPPENCLETLCRADLIYISHLHADHLSYPTLKILSEKRPDIPVFVGNTSRPVFWYLDRSGVNLTNINVVPFGVWQEVDEHLRFMILMDGVHPEMDTCIIVDYKGHMILNTVDCTQPNGGILPRNVDVMMSDFAGGAAGFPMTFTGGKYTEEWKANFIKTERRKLLNYKAQLVKSLQPRVYCPFAGYFVEAHPSDRYIMETNLKNNPEELNKLINKLEPSITTWTPKPGAVLDLARILKDPADSKAIINPPPSTKLYKDSWEFDLYLAEINSAIDSQIFQHKEWIIFYYNWAGFREYNLVIRMIETDDNFDPWPGGYDYYVDFLDLSFPHERPAREHSYEEIKNRVGVIRHVVKHGILWDDLYIGFQNRLSRDPDIYHHQYV